MKFYVVNKKPSGGYNFERFRTDFYYDDSVAKSDAPRCPLCGAFVGMLVSMPPYRVRLETWGTGFGDLAFWMSDFLVSDRFRDAYQHSGLSHIGDFESVEVLSIRRYVKFSGETPSYFRAMPKIGSARIDPNASELVCSDDKEPECKVCLSGAGAVKRWKRVAIDKSSWNGDDVFYPYGLTGTLVVTERFVNWSARFDFRNLVLNDANLSSHDFYPHEATKTST